MNHTQLPRDANPAARRTGRKADPVIPSLTGSRRAALLISRRAFRVCLRCHKIFDSDGPGNRICPPCSLLQVPDALPRGRVLRGDRGYDDER